MESTTIREHTTSGIQMQLLKNEIPIDLSSVDHVRLDMLDCAGNVQKYSSTDLPVAALVITDAPNGWVTFNPPDENVFKYQNNPYRIYFWVYESVVKKYSVPETGYAVINMEREY